MILRNQEGKIVERRHIICKFSELCTVDEMCDKCEHRKQILESVLYQVTENGKLLRHLIKGRGAE